jgi:predicted ATPase/DNA-binding XRE family transcriptional regulator
VEDNQYTASFGYWVKRRRKALDLTQEALAQQVNCAVITIKKIEADERRPSRQIAERLTVVLAIPAEERDLFLRCARGQVTPLRLPLTTQPVDRPSQPPPTNLPAAVTVFIGREREVAEVCALLQRAEVRLVTLSGPGGVGKTRLALHAASHLLEGFADGVFLINLAPIRNPELVAPAIAQALGLKESAALPAREVLKTELRHRRCLLVLDNFEHVSAAALLVAELLAAAPGLKVLITSRATVHLSGEHEFSVKALTEPEAVRLFLLRAQAADAGFKASDDITPTVAEICRRLDGLPLAVELAAARIKLWSPQQLLEKLERRLPVLIGGPQDAPLRHQTLRATLDWSYELLNDSDRGLLAQLAVFVGGWTLGAAEAVCRDPLPAGDAKSPAPHSGVLDPLISLLNQNLIQSAQVEGEPRFTMLETIREYALERLEAGGEAEAVRQRHLRYFMALAESAEASLMAMEDVEGWMRRMMVFEHDNVRAALAWALDEAHAPEAGARLVGALALFWYSHGHLREGRRWFERAAAIVPTQSWIRARALSGVGLMAWQQGDYAVARAALEEGVTLLREAGLGHADKLATALHILGHVCFDQRDYGAARLVLEESLTFYKQASIPAEVVEVTSDLGLVACHLGNNREARGRFEAALAYFREHRLIDGIALNLIRLGDLARMDDDYARAAEMFEESLTLCREVGDSLKTACSLHKLGQVARRCGDYARAGALFAESLALQQEQGNKQGLVECLSAFAGLAAATRKPERAAQLFGAAEALLETIGAPLAPADRKEWECDVSGLRAALGAATFSAHWNAGRAWPLDRAINCALRADE